MHDPDMDPERLDVFPAFEAVASIASLGDLPVIVMTAATGHHIQLDHPQLVIDAVAELLR